MYKRIGLLMLLLIVLWCPVGQSADIEKDSKWYTLIDDSSALIQIDETVFASRWDSKSGIASIICWMRVLSKKDSTKLIVNQEYLVHFNETRIQTRIIQSFSNGKSSGRIREWHDIPLGSFEHTVFKEIANYDLFRGTNK